MKPDILSEKLKTLKSSNYHRVGLFVEILLVSQLSRSTKGCSGFFNFIEIFSYLRKDEKTCFQHTHRNQVFHVLLITQDLNKTKKIPKTLL